MTKRENILDNQTLPHIRTCTYILQLATKFL
jgi:hypothetical protein